MQGVIESLRDHRAAFKLARGAKSEPKGEKADFKCYARLFASQYAAPSVLLGFL